MMILMSPVLCVSHAFYFYRVVCSLLCCICCHQTNHIPSMISMTMMGLTLGPLVRTLSSFSLNFDHSIGSVSGLGSGVFVPTGVESKCDVLTFVVFVPI